MTKYKGKVVEDRYKLNKLFVCPECRRVWMSYREPVTGKRRVVYLDSSFPKYQEEGLCYECGGDFKGDIVSVENGSR